MATDTQFIITMMLLLGGIVYVTAMFVYRKIAQGESFDLQKYGQTFGYVAIVALIAYVTTGALPNFEEILNQVLESGIPGLDAILTLATALIIGIVQKVSRIGTTTTTTAVVSSTSGTTANSTSVSTGAGKVQGIYGGSARGDTPKAAITYDVNMVPTLFFDIQASATGAAAAQLIIDNVIQKEFMPDTQGVEPMITVKFNAIGEILPVAFYLDQKYRTTGDHSISLRMGRFDAKGLISEWVSLDTFKLTLTGTKFTE
jgi:hypothetical protein